MSKYDVILDVYENQSISKAAQKHNYTQSAVSQSIRNYEKEMVCFNNPFTMRSCYWSVLLEWTEKNAK